MKIFIKANIDQCRSKDLFGNTVTGNFTVPQGISGIFGNPRNNGWKLLKDHIGRRDYWEKKKTQYRYPKGK